MIRQEIKKYMKDNKASMGFSHLEVWFTKKYQGVSQKECKRLLRGVPPPERLFTLIRNKSHN